MGHNREQRCCDVTYLKPGSQAAFELSPERETTRTPWTVQLLIYAGRADPVFLKSAALFYVLYVEPKQPANHSVAATPVFCLVQLLMIFFNPTKKGKKRLSHVSSLLRLLHTQKGKCPKYFFFAPPFFLKWRAGYFKWKASN